MKRVLLLLALATGAAGCEEQVRTPAQTAAVADDSLAEDETAAARDEGDEGDDAPEEAAPQLGDLDSLDEGDLQSACFHGSQAACDRLGH